MAVHTNSMKLAVLGLGLLVSAPKVFSEDAWQRKFDEIKQTRIQNGCDPDPKMEDFVGGVYQGGGSYIISGNVANGPNGPIIMAGDTFFTPDGVYIKSGDTYIRSRGGAIVRAGDTFLAGENTRTKAGNAYVGAGGVSIVGGNAVFRSNNKEQEPPNSASDDSYPYTPDHVVVGTKTSPLLWNGANNIKTDLEEPKTHSGTYPDKVRLFASTFADMIAKQTPGELKKGETLRLTFRVMPDGSVEQAGVSTGDANSPLANIADRALQKSLNMVGPMSPKERKAAAQGVDMVLKFSSF